MRFRLRFLIAAIILLCLLPVVALSTFLLVRTARQQFWQDAQRYAVSFGNTVLSATRHSMLTFDRTELGAIIDAVSRQKGVREARVYDGEGRYLMPLGRAAPNLDLSGPGCTPCHPDSRHTEPSAAECVHRTGSQLRLFQPILSEPACLGPSCHSGSQRLLGLLEVQIDLTEGLAKVRRLTAWAFLWGLLVLGLAVVPLFWVFRRIMERPLAESLRVVRGVAGGDLSVRSRMTPVTEWGELLSALDSMTGSLEEARAELETLNRDLEGQVSVRTRELEAALAEARESDRVKSEFVSGISHEFATPLQGAIGYAELLLDGIEGELQPGQRHDVEVILKSCRRLLELVEDLLELARLGKGLEESPAQRISLEPVLREVTASGGRLAAGRPVEVALDLRQGCPPVLGDPVSLGQLLLHLVEYAARNMDAGRILVEATPEGVEFVQVTVTATGSSAQGDVLRSALEGYSPEGGGAGLGVRLALARRLVELRGGTVQLGRVAGGTCVHIRLPSLRDAGPSGA